MIAPMGYDSILFLVGVVFGGGLAVGWMYLRARKAQAGQTEELDRYRRSQNFAKIGTWDWSIKNDVLYWSDEIYDMFGYARGEVVPSYDFFLKCLHPDDLHRVQAAEGACLEQQIPHDITYRVIWRDGNVRWLRESGDVLFDDNGTPVRFTGILRDVTQRKIQAEEIHHLAHYDSLTGLANRELFRQKLSEAIGRADRHTTMVALVFMDLNKFKPINDTYGHQFGDKVLIQIAQKLQGALRSVDNVARVGGDEFIATLEDIKSEQEAWGVAEKLRATFDADLVVDDHFFKIGASIGISLYPQDSKDVEELIHIADMAMYKEKKSA